MSQYLQTYTGPMKGVLRWPQLEAIWQTLDANDGWYLYEIGSELPTHTVSANELDRSVSEMDRFLRAEHEADYCGVVYTDDFDRPSLLKIYHPKKMGASCGSSGTTILPRWTLSRQIPIDLLAWALVRDEKPAWWKQLLKKR